MCRFLAYVARRPIALADLLPTHLPGFVGLARENPDGWGMGYYDGDRGPSVQRSLRSAGEDEGFWRHAARPLGDTGIVHLRSATPPLEINFANSHPFVRGSLMMAHNGAIFPQEDLDPGLATGGWQQHLDGILAAGSRHRPQGDTDSERYFLAILTAMDEGHSPVEAIRRTVAHLLDHYRPSCLNTLFATPDTLYAVSWHQEEPYPDEYYRLFSAETLLTYFDLRYRLDDLGLVVASTGWTQDGWHTVSGGHVLAIRRADLALTEHDLFSDRSVRLDGRELGVPDVG